MSADPATPRLRMEGISKSFGATVALDGVHMTVAAGEAHALIGENGAGKSTLMKILSGACRSDAGGLWLNGEPFEPQDPCHARRAGIATIYQELTLAPDLSVEENILLGQEPARWGWLNRRRRRDLATRALEALHHPNIELGSPVSALTIAEQQVVEIARALIGEPKVLLMDEPTSSLSRSDTVTLFRVIGRLRQRGVSVIYISHFLEECLEVCQRFTVLRDGRTVATGRMDETEVRTLARHMVGRDIAEIYPTRQTRLGRPVLELSELAGVRKPRRVSLTLHAGEILGIAGLIGAGRTETVRVCFGLDTLKHGAVRVLGRESSVSHPHGRQAQGMGLLSENRKEEGLMLNRSLADNLTMTRFGPISWAGWIRPRHQRQAALNWISRLDIKARDPDQPAGALSGGNQQKVALARLLHQDARILLLDEPTRGIDVASKAQIYRLMGELAGQGKAILFISSYLPELLGVCDTLAVMCRGVLSAVRPASSWTEHSLILEAVGQSSREGGANATG